MRASPSRSLGQCSWWMGGCVGGSPHPRPRSVSAPPSPAPRPALLPPLYKPRRPDRPISVFYVLSFRQVIWPALEEKFGWTRVNGPRVNDAYFMPMGVVRGKNGAKCRVDYYDSFRQVGSFPPPRAPVPVPPTSPSALAPPLSLCNSARIQHKNPSAVNST